MDSKQCEECGELYEKDADECPYCKQYYDEREGEPQ